MVQSEKHTARFIAAQVLGRFKPERHYAGAILNKMLDQTNQKQRATDLVFGTIRNRYAIDRVINTFSGCPANRIQKKLINIIRIGCYEIIYSPETPEHSIVNEAAQNTKAIAGQKQVGFINALLRKVLRHVSNRQILLSEENSKRTLPQTIETGCIFDADFLPDSDKHPAEYLSIAFSLPKWLVTDWISEFGYHDTVQVCFASNRRPSVYIRPNTLKTTADELIDKFIQEDIELDTVPNESVLRIKSPRTVSQLPGYNEGLFVVQDLAASQPVRLLEPKREWIILDMCAAPGGKATQLAEMTGDKASIVATDIDSTRLVKVKENLNRLDIKSVTVMDYERICDLKIDCILLDVPCSNTGVFAKRIEARYRINSEMVEKLAGTQKELLEKAAAMLKPQGKICYSTCSIQRKENADVIREFLERHQDFKLVNEKLVLPSSEGFDHDGGYTAIIQLKN